MTGRGKWGRSPTSLATLEARAIPEPNSGCLLWLGAINQFGYGRAGLNGRRMVAHRAAFILACGPVPDELELDHLCRVRSCINPAHLEPVTKLVNVRRGIAGTAHTKRQRAKTHCPAGHPYSGDNLFTRARGHRECRICMRDRQKVSPR
jgi:hypothetical protein